MNYRRSGLCGAIAEGKEHIFNLIAAHPKTGVDILKTSTVLHAALGSNKVRGLPDLMAIWEPHAALEPNPVRDRSLLIKLLTNPNTDTNRNACASH
jgi:hypothetical protein